MIGVVTYYTLAFKELNIKTPKEMLSEWGKYFTVQTITLFIFFLRLYNYQTEQGIGSWMPNGAQEERLFL